MTPLNQKKIETGIFAAETVVEILESYMEFVDIMERTRKENEDKQAVLNCIVDMLKTLNQKYTLIMGKDVIKETVRLLEQKDK